MQNDNQEAPLAQSRSNDMTDDFLTKYMPIEEFMAIKNLPQETVLQRIREGSCSGYTKNNQWFVARSEITTFSLQPKIEKEPQHLITKLIKGYLPLSETLWVFGVAGGILLIIPLMILGSMFNENFFMFFLTIWVFYEAIITVAVFNAAARYKGPSGWAIAAVLFVFSCMVLIGIAWLWLLSVSINGYGGGH